MTQEPDGIARLALMFTADGYLSRPIDGSSVQSPDTLKLDGNRLVFSEATTPRKLDLRCVLENFLALSTPRRNNQDVLDFAREYGPLWLCERHRFAAYHQPIITMPLISPALDDPIAAPPCAPKAERQKPRLYSEPIAAWRRLATNAGRLLDAAATLQRGAQIDAETWQVIDGHDAADFIGHWSYLLDPRWRLAENLNRWLALADVRFHIGIENSHIRPQLGPNRYTGSVLALIALELIAATVRADAISHCSACKRLFFASGNQPRPGKRVGRGIARRIYCQTCRAARVPARDAARAARARRKTKTTRGKGR